MQGHTEKWCR